MTYVSTKRAKIVKPIKPIKGGRRCMIGVPEIFELEHVCDFVAKAFGNNIYLVGSATERMDYRDVDLRMIMPDAQFAVLFGMNENGELNRFWSLLCTSISLYMRDKTGLPVDFQIQQMTDANTRHRGTRVPMAMFPINCNPSWHKLSFIDPIPEFATMDFDKIREEGEEDG